MANGDALSTFRFGVQLGGVTVESVQSVSGLSMEQNVVEVKQTTDRGELVIRKQPGGRLAGEITLTRGLDKSDALSAWLKKTMEDGNVGSARENITIEMMDSEGKTVRRYNLTDAWVSKWEGPELSAGDGNAATENVTITFDEVKIS
jgi:phage tail-like protein